MPANVISQLTAANTFQQWLGATQQLIGTSNALTDGNGSFFYANTNIIVGGADGDHASLNVETYAVINDLTVNTANVIDGTFRNVDITENVVSLRVTTDVDVGNSVYIHETLTVGGDTFITGNLVVTGNLTLDEIGFNDLQVAGSADIANNLTVVGDSTLTNVNVTTGFTVESDAQFDQNVLISGNLTVSGNVVLDEIGFNDLNVAGSADIANNLTVTGNTDLNGITNIQSANVNSLVGNANTNIYAAIAAADASALAYSIALG
jgi:hypothetical protein